MDNPNVSQLTGGAATAGQLQPGVISDEGSVKGGALHTPNFIGAGVRSVNGMTGDVVLTAEDIGAASTEALEDHIADADSHITAEERAAWNECLIGAVNAEESLTFWKAKDVI